MNIRTVLGILLLLIIATRIWSIVSLPTQSQSHKRYYVSENLGRDIQTYGINAWYAIREGNIPVVFGYGSVLITGISVQLFETSGMCHDASSCGDLIYICLAALGISGLLWHKQKLALLFCAAFALGIPVYRAIEAGNVDLFFFILFGFVLTLVEKIKQTHTHSFPKEILLGVLLGLMLNVKAFLLPFAVISLVFVRPSFALWGSFALSYCAFALWPWIFGVPAGLFDVFLFAKRDTLIFTKDLYTQINYGNNAIMPYVSNVLKAFDEGKISLTLHVLLTTIISTCVFLFIFIKPVFDEKIIPTIIQKKHIKITYPLLLVLYVLSYTGIMALPAWSYEYCMQYRSFVFFFLLFMTLKPVNFSIFQS
jgi:hypothetical protein